MLIVNYLKLQVHIKQLMPRQSLFIQLFHERIRVELFHVPDARFTPDALHEQFGTNHCWNAGRVADTLCARFHIRRMMAAIVVNIIGQFFPVFQSAYAATDGSFARIVFTQITRSISRPFALTSLDKILALAKELLRGVEYAERPIRLIGLSVSNPVKGEAPEQGHWEQLTLPFSDWE